MPHQRHGQTLHKLQLETWSSWQCSRLSFNELLVLAPPNDDRNALQASLVTHDQFVIQIHIMRPRGSHMRSGNSKVMV